MNPFDRVTAGQTAAAGRYFCPVRRSCIPSTGWPEHPHGMRDRHTLWRAWVWPRRILFRARPAHDFAGIDAHGTHGDPGPVFDFSGLEATHGKRGATLLLPAARGSRFRGQGRARGWPVIVFAAGRCWRISRVADIASHSVDASRGRASPVRDSIVPGPPLCSHEALRSRRRPLVIYVTRAG